MSTPFSPAVHGVSMSVALREAATYAPVYRVVLLTYEFVHVSFTSRQLVVCDHNDLTAQDENGITVTYLALPSLKSEGFEESDKASTPLIRLHLDGVSQLLAEELDLALAGLDPISVIERLYVSDDVTTPAILPVTRAIVKTATVTETRVSFEIGFGDPANQPFPRKVYTRAQYPGLAAQ